METKEARDSTSVPFRVVVFATLEAITTNQNRGRAAEE
jgi:hypothetical protein